MRASGNACALKQGCHKSFLSVIYLFIYLFGANQREHSSVRWHERNARSVQMWMDISFTYLNSVDSPARAFNSLQKPKFKSLQRQKEI